VKKRSKFFLVAAAVVAVLCCGCSDNGIGGAFYDQKMAKYGDVDGFVDPSTVTKGTFTDNNITYNTVKIGSQTWMAENLKHKMADSTGSWCYGQGGSADDKNGNHRKLSPDEIDAYCGEYGRLYNWETAKTACPSGWHLPSRGEWDKLMTAVGGPSTDGKKLKARSGWNDNGNGTNDYGFSALPGGLRDSYGGFGSAGNYGVWWTATEYRDNNAYYRRMGYDGDDVYESFYYYYGKASGYSVRCVKN